MNLKKLKGIASIQHSVSSRCFYFDIRTSKLNEPKKNIPLQAGICLAV